MILCKAHRKISIGELYPGECFSNNREETYMLINIPKVLIDRNVNSIIPIDKAVFAILLMTGQTITFDKDELIERVMIRAEVYS